MADDENPSMKHIPIRDLEVDPTAEDLLVQRSKRSPRCLWKNAIRGAQSVLQRRFRFRPGWRCCFVWRFSHGFAARRVRLSDATDR